MRDSSRPVFGTGYNERGSARVETTTTLELSHWLQQCGKPAGIIASKAVANGTVPLSFAQGWVEGQFVVN